MDNAYNELKAFLKNQGDNIDVDLYLGLYEKLVNAGTSGCAFIGSDYHYAYQLFQWGFVQIMMTPIRKDGFCRGNVVTFYSLIRAKEILG